MPIRPHLKDADIVSSQLETPEIKSSISARDDYNVSITKLDLGKLGVSCEVNDIDENTIQCPISRAMDDRPCQIDNRYILRSNFSVKPAVTCSLEDPYQLQPSWCQSGDKSSSVTEEKVGDFCVAGSSDFHESDAVHWSIVSIVHRLGSIAIGYVRS